MTNDSYDRIVEAATRLFASKGYHGTSMREIAKEVGLHVATVQQHVGSKEQLYQEVFRRQYDEEFKIITGVLKRYESENRDLLHDAAALKEAIKESWQQMNQRFIEFPYLVRLWVYRLLERSEFALEIDKKYSVSLYKMELDLLEKAQKVGTINPDRTSLLLWLSGFAWLHMGYFTGRNLVADLGEGDPFSQENKDKFYEFFDQYIDRMID